MANTDPYDGHGEDHRGAIHQQRGLHAWHRNGNNVRPRRTIPARNGILATIFQLHRHVSDTILRASPKHKWNGGTTYRARRRIDAYGNQLPTRQLGLVAPSHTIHYEYDDR